MHPEPLHLFLGFAIESDFDQALERVNPNLKAIFIQNQSGYLHEARHAGKHFLGKLIEGPAEIATLELAEANIYSILRKLVPDYSYEKHPLVLFPQPLS